MVSPWYQAVMTDTKALATSATMHIFSSCELSLPASVLFSSNLCYFIYLTTTTTTTTTTSILFTHKSIIFKNAVIDFKWVLTT